jgi:hypothetical protein
MVVLGSGADFRNTFCAIRNWQRLLQTIYAMARGQSNERPRLRFMETTSTEPQR